MIRNFATSRSGSARVLAAIFAYLCLAAAVPAGAHANLGTKMYELCSQGKSIAGFTVKQYQIALEQLPTEAREYSSPCVEEIVNAELAAAAHKGRTVGGQGGGSSTGVAASGAGQHVEPTPAQQQILEQTRKSGVGPVHLGGGGKGSVVPGVVHPDLASAASDLPAPVLAVIAAVIAGIALLAGKEINTRLQRSRRG
jgi:hypothetical protein